MGAGRLAVGGWNSFIQALPPKELAVLLTHLRMETIEKYQATQYVGARNRIASRNNSERRGAGDSAGRETVPAQSSISPIRGGQYVVEQTGPARNHPSSDKLRLKGERNRTVVLTKASNPDPLVSSKS